MEDVEKRSGYKFNKSAVEKFNQRNGIECIILSNKMFAQGFTFHFGGCVLNINGTSYPQLNNPAICLNIDRGKLRLIQVNKN